MLRAMYDLTESLRPYSDELDWPGLISRARQWGAERCVYINLLLAGELLNAPVPDDWLDTAGLENFDGRHLTFAGECIFVSMEEPGRALPTEFNLVEMWVEKSMTGKFLRIRRSIFVSLQRMAMMYPALPNSYRIFFCYPGAGKGPPDTAWQECSQAYDRREVRSLDGATAEQDQRARELAAAGVSSPSVRVSVLNVLASLPAVRYFEGLPQTRPIHLTTHLIGKAFKEEFSMVEKTEALRLNEQQKLNVLPARRRSTRPRPLEFIPLRTEERLAVCEKYVRGQAVCNPSAVS